MHQEEKFIRFSKRRGNLLAKGTALFVITNVTAMSTIATITPFNILVRIKFEPEREYFLSETYNENEQHMYVYFQSPT